MDLIANTMLGATIGGFMGTAFEPWYTPIITASISGLFFAWYLKSDVDESL